jgi:plasmid stability protein
MEYDIRMQSAFRVQRMSETMKTLTIRAVPEHVYNTLKSLAAANHRSLQEQISEILERETTLVRGGQPARLRRWRKLLAGRRWGNLVEDIRSERQR